MRQRGDLGDGRGSMDRISRVQTGTAPSAATTGSRVARQHAMICKRVMSKVSHRIEAMEKDTLMVAVAIEKIADPDSAALAIYEISAFRERHGRYVFEEDKDRVRENDKYKEVDPCAMMMNTTMFDEANPMMEWLNEDEEHEGQWSERKRVLEEDEDDYIDCDDDEEEDEYIDIDDEDECGDDSASEADGEDSTTRVEKINQAKMETRLRKEMMEVSELP
ncbi:hypothetical protein ZWY2020_057954 [Hordeum vulgare]|nr:hypothetical protein ZWY2020_057954 [Hordeum vulgare]